MQDAQQAFRVFSHHEMAAVHLDNSPARITFDLVGVALERRGLRFCRKNIGVVSDPFLSTRKLHRLDKREQRMRPARRRVGPIDTETWHRYWLDQARRFALTGDITFKPRKIGERLT